MDFVRELIASRGGQLVARYANFGVIWLAGKLGTQVAAGDVDSTSKLIGTLAVSAVLLGLDHWSHSKQQA